MNKTILAAGGAVLAIGAMVATSGVAFAANQMGNGNGNGNGKGSGYTQQLETKATTLKLTTDQLKEQLETKTLAQIAEEKNVALSTIHEAIQTQAKARWEANGATAEEIAAREASMTERQADCDGDGKGMGAGQMRHGRNAN